MTEPRPRLTNTIGSIQQTSVVTDDTSPSTLHPRSRMDPPRETENSAWRERLRSAARMYAGAEDRAVERRRRRQRGGASRTREPQARPRQQQRSTVLAVRDV